MTTAQITAAPAPQAAAPGPQPGARDVTIDAVRTACLLVVVVLHALMVGVQYADEGGIATSVAMDGERWFAPVTWALQVMPLFFIAGGFASLNQWRRMRDRGEHWTQYVIGRTRRLVIPAAAMILIVGLVLGGARALGLSEELAMEAGYRIAQPLWFLAVYVGATALIPAMAWLHVRLPRGTLAAFGAGIAGVEAARLVTGIESIGYLNLAFVWLFAQQLGFFARDWKPRATSRTGIAAGTVVIGLTMVALIASGIWTADLIANLNPPTILIALLTLVHFGLLRLAKPALDRALTGDGTRRVIAAANPHAMTIYLWHMPVIMLLIGGIWALGLPLPEPHSALWWATRLPWILVIAAAMVPASRLLQRFELLGQRVPRPERMPAPLAAAAAVTAVAGVTAALLAGLAQLETAGAAFGLLALSLALGSATLLRPRRVLGDG